MDIIKEKIVLFSGMLQKLETAIVLSCKYECLSNIEATKENKMLLRTMRDATFLRFKCCVDLFWKVLKLHLEEVENIELPINSPRAIVREAVTARLLTESEGREYMAMVESRNKTSHMYHQEIADIIARNIPKYYESMNAMVDRIQTLIAKNNNI